MRQSTLLGSTTSLSIREHLKIAQADEGRELHRLGTILFAERVHARALDQCHRLS